MGAESMTGFRGPAGALGAIRGAGWPYMARVGDDTWRGTICGARATQQDAWCMISGTWQPDGIVGGCFYKCSQDMTFLVGNDIVVGFRKVKLIEKRDSAIGWPMISFGGHQFCTKGQV